MAINLNPTLIPMHWGVSKGGHFVDGELNTARTVATEASSGQKEVPLSDATGLLVGQVVVYTQTTTLRNHYYTSKIEAINGNTVTLQDNLEVTVAAGGNFFAYYTNYAHCTPQGIYANIDYAKRYLATHNAIGDENRILDHYSYNQNDFSVIGTATAGENSTNSSTNPGSPEYPSIAVTCNAAGDGVCFEPAKSYLAGSYAYEVCLNPVNAGSVVTIEVKQGASVLDTHTLTAEGACIKTIRNDFLLVSNGTITLEITKNSGEMDIGYARILKKIVSDENLNRGTHVVFGDSWATFDNVLKVHYPLITTQNAGVGGNTAKQCYERFDADVATHNPDFVWLVVGTNDYFNSVPHVTFSQYVQLIAKRCYEIGAKLIVFDTSVGVRVYSGKTDWQLTNKSHELTLRAAYNINWEENVSTKSYFIKIKKEYIPSAVTNFPFVFRWKIPSNYLPFIESAANIAIYNGVTKLPRIIDKLDLINKIAVISFNSSASSDVDTEIEIRVGTGITDINDVLTYRNSSHCLRYNYNENSGAIVDSCGNYNTLVQSNISYSQEGVLDSAVSYTGTAYTSSGDVTQINSAAQLSITTVDKRDADGVTKYLWSKAVGNFSLLYTAANSLRVTYGAGDYATLTDFRPHMPLGQYSVVKVVFNLGAATAAAKVQLYINGVYIPFNSFTGTVPAGIEAVAGQAFWMGYSTTSSYDGDVDELRISTAVQSADFAAIEASNFLTHDLFYKLPPSGGRGMSYKQDYSYSY